MWGPLDTNELFFFVFFLPIFFSFLPSIPFLRVVLVPGNNNKTNPSPKPYTYKPVSSLVYFRTEPHPLHLPVGVSIEACLTGV